MNLMSRPARVCLVLALLGLAACAGVEAQKVRANAAFDAALATLNAQPASSQFKRSVVDPPKLGGDKRRFQFGAGSPVIEAHGGKSYYQLLELPAFTSPYQIEICPSDQHLGNDLATGTFGSIWPAATLLDAQMQVIESRMPYYGYVTFVFANPCYFGYVSVCDAQPRYVALHGLPPTYRSVERNLINMYSQYGTSSVLHFIVQMPDGEVSVRAVQKGYRVNPNGLQEEVQACERADRSVQQFLTDQQLK